MVKKLIGSVMDVFRAQGYSEETLLSYARMRGYEENRTVIGRDLPRTALVDFSGKTHKDFSEECATEENYHGHYIQGAFDGGAAVDIYQLYVGPKIIALWQEINDLPLNSEEQNLKLGELTQFQIEWFGHGACKDLRFAYRDDDGKLCAVGFIFRNGHPDCWVLQIFTGTTIPELESRQTTLFAQGELVTAATALTIDAASLPEEIKLALNSEKVNELLSGLIGQNGNVSVEKFNELNSRLDGNRNIDNSDAKKRQLDELILHVEALLPDSAMIQEIKQRALSDINFFLEDNFRRTYRDILIKVEESNPAQLLDKVALDIYDLTVHAIGVELDAADNSNALQQVDRNVFYKKAAEMRKARDLLVSYQANLDIFQKKLTTVSKPEFQEQGVIVLDNILDIVADDPAMLSFEELTQLNEVLTRCSNAIDDPNDRKNLKRIAELSQVVSGKSSPLWKSLGAALLMFTGIALVAAGLLGALPTGGTSLILATVGVAALVGAGAGAIMHGSQYGLSKSMSGFFKAAVSQAEDDGEKAEPVNDVKPQ